MNTAALSLVLHTQFRTFVAVSGEGLKYKWLSPLCFPGSSLSTAVLSGLRPSSPYTKLCCWILPHCLLKNSTCSKLTGCLPHTAKSHCIYSKLTFSWEREEKSPPSIHLMRARWEKSVTQIPLSVLVWESSSGLPWGKNFWPLHCFLNWRNWWVKWCAWELMCVCVWLCTVLYVCM